MSEVLLRQLIVEVRGLRARVAALETAEVIPSQLQAADGDPNPALSADASGNLVALNGAWVGADAACSWVFDSTNGDVTTLDKVGIGDNSPSVQCVIYSADGVNSADFITKIINDDVTGGQSNGLVVQAGVTATDASFAVKNQAGSDLLRVKGDSNVVIASLAGVGNRAVIAAADGTLSAP